MNGSSLLQQVIPYIIAAAVFFSILLVSLLFSKKTETAATDFLGRYRTNLTRQVELLNLPISVNQFMMLQGAVVLLLFAVGLLTGPDFITKLVMGVVFGATGWILSRRYILDKHKQRQTKFKEQFADAASLIGNSVRSGLSLQQSLDVLVREMDDPMAYEVYQVMQATKMGTPLDTALEQWAARMNNPDLDIFVTAINIQRQTGGDLSFILGTLGTTIRQRHKIQGQIQALTAQGRVGAYVLSGMPIFMGGVLYFLNPSRMSLMFTHPIGLGMLAVTATTITLGIFVIRRIVDIDI